MFIYKLGRHVHPLLCYKLQSIVDKSLCPLLWLLLDSLHKSSGLRRLPLKVFDSLDCCTRLYCQSYSAARWVAHRVSTSTEDVCPTALALLPHTPDRDIVPDMTHSDRVGSE